MTTKLMVFDFETSDNNKYTCRFDRVCFSEFNPGGSERLVYDLCFRNKPVDPYHNKLFKKLLADPSIPKVAHNMAFDLYLVLYRMGLDVKGDLHDTRIMASHYRNDIPAYGLKALAWTYLGDLHTPLMDLHIKDDGDNNGMNMCEYPTHLVHNYCVKDVLLTAQLFDMFYPHVKDNYAYKQDMELTKEMCNTDNHGVCVNILLCKKMKKVLKCKVTRNTHIAQDDMGVDGSPAGDALRDRLEDLGATERTSKGFIKASKNVMEKHQSDKAVGAILKAKHNQKILSTYVSNIMVTVTPVKKQPSKGVIHINLIQSASATRRFRSRGFFGENGVKTKGNSQNFPRGRGVRDCICVPDDYWFLKLDLASIEARLASHAMSVFLGFDYYCKQYKKDDKFNMYLHIVNTHTEHSGVTKKDPIYTAYKHACLGIQYGVGVKTFYKTLVDTFKLPYSYDTCCAIYNTIRRKCPEFAMLQGYVSSMIEKDGFVLDDFGSIYYIPKDLCYKGVNAYCQGCAGNVLKWWWLRVCDKIREFRSQDYTFNTVHDELDMAIHKDRSAEKRVTAYCDVLQELDIFELPIIAEASGLVNNWGEAG